jgi:hypothetical protein
MSTSLNNCLLLKVIVLQLTKYWKLFGYLPDESPVFFYSPASLALPANEGLLRIPSISIEN